MVIGIGEIRRLEHNDLVYEPDEDLKVIPQTTGIRYSTYDQRTIDYFLEDGWEILERDDEYILFGKEDQRAAFKNSRLGGIFYSNVWWQNWLKRNNVKTQIQC